MRINFNMTTSKLLASYRAEDVPTWLAKLLNNWFAAYDINDQCQYAYRITWSKEGAIHFHKWLEFEGFQVNFWEMDFRINDDIAAFGIEFVDSCPKFIEAKLSAPCRITDK
jgi:hypothetical protein